MIALDLIVVDLLYENRPVPEKLQESLNKLLQLGIVERTNQQKSHRFVLSRLLYSVVGEKGVYARKKGLDRATNKELVLKHIRDNDKAGSKMEELKQVLPSLALGSIQSLLRELVREGIVYSQGRTRAGKWHYAPHKK